VEFVKGTFQTVVVQENEDVSFRDVLGFLCSNPYWGWEHPGRLIKSGGVRVSYKWGLAKDFNVVTNPTEIIRQFPLFLNSQKGRKLVIVRRKTETDTVIKYRVSDAA